MHGRNQEVWNIKDAAASSRINYDYNDDELYELAARIQKFEERVERTHVVFNNNFEPKDSEAPGR
ncbi:DUF72 domain-containing protein [Paraburkholderia sp. BR14374]|uniref:DUF72 domain-containing protein n=1 Tax=Paraburkholderia sp. BR14374 TaxID=3237007 RepID=UPI0034CD826B